MNKNINDSVNLNEIVRDIQNRKILLPDFQRGFVWKEEARQKKLVESVIAKMPLGSILMLEANAQEYGCKMIGRNKSCDVSDLGEQKVKMLLDGQQRITVLANIFSNIILDNTDDEDLISSAALCRRFFLSLPCYGEKSGIQKDIFGLSNLFFAIPESGIPRFLTEDVDEYLCVESFKYYKAESTKIPPYSPQDSKPSDIENYCTNTDTGRYRIPLYMLIETHENDLKYETTLKNILSKIADDVVYRMMDEYRDLDEENRRKFINEKVQKQFQQDITNINDFEVVHSQLNNQGRILWADRIYTYLKSCISELDLHQIIVSESARDRAIDIYENLNLGGVTLSTFELVMAKAAKIQGTSGKNLAERIADYITESKDKSYSKDLVPDCVKDYFEEYTRNGEYSASYAMRCCQNNGQELNKNYTDAFLDVLCLLANNPEHYVEKVSLPLIKRDKILELSAEQINEYCIDTCKGLDRAIFFLQVRCGLRNIDELQYNLMLVLLGYIFTVDKYYKSNTVHRRLESFYWTAVFSGEFDHDQNQNMIECLRNCLLAFEKSTESAFDWIVEMKNNVFNMPDYSDSHILLLESNKTPKDVIRNSICQYYLACTYPDLISRPNEKSTINIFMDGVKDLEQHHLVPIGSMKMINVDDKYDRKKKEQIINSPLNFVYITPKANKDISGSSIESYLKYCNAISIFKLNLHINGEPVDTPEKVKEIMKTRFDTIKNDVIDHINQLAGIY